MLKKVILLGLALRLILAFWGQHSDIDTYYWWSKDLLINGMDGFYDRYITNTIRALYPPVTSYIFWFNGIIHEAIWKILWFINLKISFFPSNLIFWWESKFSWYYLNKLPAILADIGIIYILYKIVTLIKSRRLGIIAAGLFAFLPPFWYNSAVWGQIDSIYMLPVLLACYFLIKKNFYLPIIFYGLAVFTKPIVLFTAPIFLLWWLKGRSFREIFISILIILGQVFLLYYPFHRQDTLVWAFQFYRRNLIGELHYINANAFNLWGLLFGFGEVSYKKLFLQIPLNLWGYLAYLLSLSLVIYKVVKSKINDPRYWFLAMASSSFSAFMFLPAMHERYFYPAIVILVILVTLYKKLNKVFWPIVFIHLINLYHFWWYPRVAILIKLFSNMYIERLVVLINIILFYWLFSFTLSNNSKRRSYEAEK